MKYSIIVLFIFYGTLSFPQDVSTLTTQVNELSTQIQSLRSEIYSEQSNHSEFVIYGEIKERNIAYISIWGSALPLNQDFSLPGTINEGNIVVLNPDKGKIVYNYYVNAKHFYLYKSYGKNAFNADVPIYYFGEQPEDTKTLIARKEIELSGLVGKKNKLSQVLNEKKKEELLNDAIVYTNKAEYIEAIDKLKQALNLFPEDQDINKLLYINTFEQIKIDTSKGEYETAIARTNEATQIRNLSPMELNTLNDLHSEICIRIAEKKYYSADYTRAIEYYKISLQNNQGKLGQIESNFADAYYQIGSTELKRGNIKTAKEDFEKSINFNRNNEVKISNELDQYKRSPVAEGLTSIIPGLGQIIQGESTKGLTQTTLFVTAVLAGYFSKVSADYWHNQYLKTTDVNKVTTYYNEANSRLIASYVAFDVGAAIIIYSIIDSYLIARKYNKSFEIGIQTIPAVTGSFNNSYCLSFKIYF